MSLYRYKGRTKAGNAVSGQIEAASSDSAAGLLIEKGITPININEARQAADSGLQHILDPLITKRPGLDDMIMFSRQMYTLVKAGIPLNRAINGLLETTRNPMLSDALAQIVNALDAGYELSVSLAQHPKVFPYMLVSMVRVGENTGQLENAFQRVAAMLEHEKDTRNRIKAALRYPSFVVAAIIAAVIILNIFVIPTFADVFARFGAQLPLPTRVIIATSKFTVEFWPYMLAAIGGAAVALRTYLKTPVGAYQWGRLKLKIPVIGSIVYRASLARFAKTFATATRSGIPMVQALNIVIKAEENPYIANSIELMCSTIERGDTLYRSAMACGLFTPVVLQMLAVGEETGALDAMLFEMAEFYEREVDYDLKNLSAAIEPILIIIIGCIVLVLALGIFLPMWDLSSAAFHR